MRADAPTLDLQAGTPPSAPNHRWQRALVIGLLVVALLLPLAVVVVRLVGTDWLLTRDSAGIDLRARDVFSSHVPLIGAYHGTWSHPGPLMFWTLSPFLALFGTAGATVVGIAVLQTVVVAGAGWVAWRCGGVWLLLLTATVVALAYRALDTEGPLTLVWNPSFALPCFVLFALAIGLVVTGHPRLLILATAAGSFAVQAHVGYVPLILVLGVWAVVLVVLDERTSKRSTHTPGLRSTFWWSFGVAALLWIGPVLDAALHRGGNLRRLAKFLVSGDEGPVAGVRRGFELFATDFRWPPPWLVGRESVDRSGVLHPTSLAWLLLPVVLLVVGYGAARISGSRRDRRLVVMAALACVTAVFALARTTLPSLPPYFWWSHVVALLVLVVTAVAVVDAIGARRFRPAATPVAAILTLVVLATSISVASATSTRIDDARRDFTAARALLPRLEAAMPTRGAVLVRPALDQSDLFGALVDELDRAGRDVRVDGGFPNETEYGKQRTASARDAAQVWIVAQDGWLVSDLQDHDGATIVATYSPLTGADEARLAGLQRRIADALRAADRSDLLPTIDAPEASPQLLRVPGIDAAEVRELVALNRNAAARAGRRSIVVAVPRGQAAEFTNEALTPPGRRRTQPAQ